RASAVCCGLGPELRADDYRRTKRRAIFHRASPRLARPPRTGNPIRDSNVSFDPLDWVDWDSSGGIAEKDEIARVESRKFDPFAFPITKSPLPPRRHWRVGPGRPVRRNDLQSSGELAPQACPRGPPRPLFQKSGSAGRRPRQQSTPSFCRLGRKPRTRPRDRSAAFEFTGSAQSAPITLTY